MGAPIRMQQPAPGPEVIPARRLDQETYETLALALGYPGEGAAGFYEAAALALERHLPEDAPGRQEAPSGIRALARFARDADVGRLQEAYSSAFDLQPVCTLGVGYHVFGESYKRGRLLAGLQATVERFGLTAVPTFLPDDLPILLRLIPRLYAEEPEGTSEAFDLLSVCVLPALEKMEAAFSGTQNPYGALIQGVGILLRSDHPDAREAARAQNYEVFLP